MLTKNEINSLTLSPTKKDFVQIWNELLEVAGKLSERWDPTSTNESDPGIVILKALTAIADKLNYNIDKNTLEAFMPTAAQEDSMRKLCDMLGYNIKYYQSAVTPVTIKYHNPDPSEDENDVMLAPGLTIPKFTVITNNDGDINYFTKEDILISDAEPTKKVTCIEGQLVKCESLNNNNVITINQISEGNRFYLPETQVAENGIFVYNIKSDDQHTQLLVDDIAWEKVDNLNIQTHGSHVFKFGFDSYESRPYLEFPEDYSELFKDGVFIYYTRTSGVNGNISAGTLTQIELPKSDDWDKVSAESFSVTNTFSTTTGSNAETITQAYNSFKKTVGTFNTLVTCRDYMNKIYSMTDDSNNKPLVSNILVADIRTDLNRAVTICSCDDAGIFYRETPAVLSTTLVGDPVEKSSTQAELTKETPYELVGREENYGFEEVRRETFDYKLVGEEADYKYEEVERETIPGEETSTTYDPVEIENITTVTGKISEANKPVYAEIAANVEFTLAGMGNTYTRNTNWRLGSTEGIPLFADSRADSFIKVDYQSFDCYSDGEVLSTNSKGEPADFWYIKQGGTYFKTVLPITKIDSTTTTIKNQVTIEVEKPSTTYIKEQRSLEYTSTTVVQEQRTLKERSTETYTITKILEQEVANDYAIDHFDLVFYPFKSYNQINSSIKDIRNAYDASFTLDTLNFNTIEQKLMSESLNSISHSIKKPVPGDCISINNYLRLSAAVATNFKVTAKEGDQIINNIKMALANAFNMHELDFGEEIPFESIVSVIENADARIKVVSLNEPALYTTFTVLDHYEYTTPVLYEYAVASDWLTADMAYATGRFGNAINGTFNTNEAKKIYNKLAVRNVLAGRIPLFNYDNTFGASFSESAYQETTQLGDESQVPLSEILGLGLPIPTADAPYVVWVHSDGTIYTGIYNKSEPDELLRVTYYKTGVPKKLESVLNDNIITEVSNENIVELQSNCTIKTDAAAALAAANATGEQLSLAPDAPTNKISKVTLADNEYVRFRAPSFTTVKTYPAYVNYHLALNKEYLVESESARAATLFNILNQDRENWSPSQPNIGWQKVLDYFTANKPSSIRNYLLSQRISAYSEVSETSTDPCNNANNKEGTHVINDEGTACKYCGTAMTSNELTDGPILLSLDTLDNDSGASFAELFAKCGCVKFVADDKDITFDNEIGEYVVKAQVKWDVAAGEKVDGEGPDLTFEVPIGRSPFIIDSNIVSLIKEAVNKKLDELRDMVKEGKPALPTEHAWTISFNFVCVPFEADTLDIWTRFVKETITKSSFGFTPIEDNGVILWRVFNKGYQIGEDVLESTEKLLKFDSSYFGVLPDIRLKGIYLVEYRGKDAKPAMISNNTEYALKANEYLYIEYTPSTTSDDGTTKDLDPVTEIHGPGTVIKPSGFEGGIIDSTINGASPFKKVTFKNPTGSGNITLDMQRFGANEQVEIREPAKVELTKDSFKSSNYIYVYKNFNNALLQDEKLASANGYRTYTLQDGEYVFYTDQNKNELAYFTSGTQVALSGGLVIPSADAIDIAEILESGIQVVPWERLNFKNNEKLTFQEYQYVTLGPGDTIEEITLTEQNDALDNQWQYCDSIAYSLAGSTDIISPSPVSAYNAQAEVTKGNGWEACSILEIDMSADKAQTLRNDGQVVTSLTAYSTSSSGGGSTGDLTIVPDDPNEGDPASVKTVSVKTNLACYSNNGQVTLKDAYLNSDGLDSFTLKVFAADTPMIVETAPGRVVSAYKEGVTDVFNWTYEEALRQKDYAELWTSVELSSLISKDLSYDKALRLPINIIPNTYGVFSIYLKYYGEQSARTWIELMPGLTTNDVIPLNISEDEIEDYIIEPTSDEEGMINRPERLLLRPGVNCIRVNKSCQLFIKTSRSAQGTLCFDNLRLVKCQQLEYTLKNDDGTSTTTTTTTQGLNLDQLGYFWITDKPNIDLTDEEVYLSLKTDSVNKAYTLLDSESAQASGDFATFFGEILNLKAKIQKIVEIEESITKDLDYLSNTDNISSEELSNLIVTYNNINALIEKEQSLLDALNANKNLADSEQQLEQLLTSFNTTETLQQQLRSRLDLLITNATLILDHLEVSDILSDFSESEDIDTKNSIFSEVKRVATEKLTESYESQLDALANKLEQVTGSEESNRLLTLLTEIQAERNSEDRTKLTTLVHQLKAAVEHTDLDTWLVELDRAASSKEYSQLAAVLLQIRAIIDARDIKLMVSELEQAIVEFNDAQAVSLVAELKTFIEDSEVTADTSIQSIVLSIDTLRTEAQASTPNSSTINEKLKNLREDIEEFYEDQRDTFLAAIEDLLNKLLGTAAVSSGLTTKDILIQNITALSTSFDDDKIMQIEDCLDQISTAIENHTILSEDIETSTAMDSWEDNILEYIQEGIIAVWPAQIKTKVGCFVDQVKEHFESAIDLSNLDKAAALATLESLADTYLTATAKKLISNDSFNQLFSEIMGMLANSSQNIANIELLNLISSNISWSSEIAEAMDALKTNNDSRNANIIELINQLSAIASSDVATKRKLVSSLKTELTTAIELDNQILNVLATVLYPTILELEQSTEASDSFYEQLIDTAAKTKEYILKASLANLTDSYRDSDGKLYDSRYLDLLESDMEDFRDNVLEFDIDLSTCFSTDFIESMSGLKLATKILAEISLIKESDLVKLDRTEIENLITDLETADLIELMQTLIAEIKDLDDKKIILDKTFEEAYETLQKEKQLLAEIRLADRNKEFFYSVPVEPHLAIDFNEGDKALNTLLNPITNYDINNINNSFVISKLDIDYLSKGIKIARSSQIS